MSKDIKKMAYETEIKYLESENAQLKHEIDKQKNYNMSHAQRISELKKENKKLENENFKYFLEEDETNDYIDKLKLELFDLYRNKQ